MTQQSEEHILNTIKGLTSDSRHVKPGFLFAAIPGTKIDGSRYIKEALEKGAVAILCTQDTYQIHQDFLKDVPCILSSNPRKKLAKLAGMFYQPTPNHIVAVTGTNGKTSVTSFYRMLIELNHIKAASIGTPGVMAEGYTKDFGLTTPDPVDLQSTLYDLKKEGFEHIAMEASSHGLDMYRLDGLTLQAAALTNITQDHLDYHETLANYRACKLRLFEELLPRGGVAVVNSTIDEFDMISKIAAHKKQELISYGIDNGQISCIQYKAHPHGFDLKLRVMGYVFDVSFPLIGHFQIENALCALALVIATGGDIHTYTPLLAQLSCVPGRIDQAGTTKNNVPVYVDYAHTPDALYTILKNIRPHTEKRIILVFGCGGNRDQGKRPMMGKIAEEHADITIITDDNPRFENPEDIRNEIIKACPKAYNIASRKEAIQKAIDLAEKGDLILVAGKGHERYQIIKDVSHPFSDHDVIKELTHNHA